MAETPSVILRLSRASIKRMATEDDPQLAGSLRRLFVRTLAERLTDRMRAIDTLLD